MPMTHAVIQHETKRDGFLSDVYQKAQNSWQPDGKGSLYELF